jgi:hypothetical protein
MNDGRCACAAARSAASPARRRAAPLCLGLSLALAALVPKCPMCLVAYLSILGLGGGVAISAYPALRPLSVALIVLSAVAVVLQRRARHRSSASRRPLAAGGGAGAG